MRFFEAQKVARAHSFQLIVLFILNVIVLSALNTFVLSLLIKSANPILIYGFPFAPKIFAFSALAFIFITIGFIAQAPKGPALAEAMGGRLLLQPNTDNERKLKNVIEEMAIASGTAIPTIYILDNEVGINAFAAGSDPSSVVIVVTKGTIDQLSRDELQGVIGHEFSHILNGDMALNMNLAGVVASFQVFMKAGQMFLRPRRYSRINVRQGDSQFYLLAIVLVAFGGVGFFLGRFIQSFISREREYLADASSAQFTRNPECLARALGKIILGGGSEITGSEKLEYSHMFFAEGLAPSLTFFFATHPPIRERIARLLPNVNIDDFLTIISKDLSKNQAYQVHAEKVVEKTIQKIPIPILQSIGSPTANNFAVSRNMMDEISPIRNFLYDEKISRAVLALITFRSQTSSETIYSQAAQEIKHEFATEEIFEKIKSIVDKSDQVRVTLFHLSLATLSKLPQIEKQKILDQMKSVFDLDGKLSLLEAFLYINAIAILAPGKLSPTQIKTKSSADSVAAMAEHFDNVEFDQLNAFVAENKLVSLTKKKEIVEQLLHYFVSDNQGLKEEFRLLCLAIGIPVPPW